MAEASVITVNYRMLEKGEMFSGGLDRKETCIADAKSAIDHLPLETEGIVLTGGEVTVVKETLREVAEYVHAVRAERFPHLKLSMETNGTWVHDQHSAYLGMLELHSWGIDQIIFSGNDEAHAQAGLNTDLIMRGHDSPVSHAAERIAFELYRLGIPYTPPEFGGAWFHLPLGRALETQTDFRNFLPCFHQRSSVREGLTMAVDVDGRLSPCVFGVVPSISLSICLSRSLMCLISARVLTTASHPPFAATVTSEVSPIAVPTVSRLIR